MPLYEAWHGSVEGLKYVMITRMVSMLREVKIRYVKILVVITMAAIFAGCDDGNTQKVATSQQMQQEVKPKEPLPPTGVEFNLSASALPGYVVVSGLSAAESWGRWSDSDQVVFRFGSNLPEKFALVISAKAYGPNAGLAIPVKVGGQVLEMKLSADITTDIRLEFFPNTISDNIEIIVPYPTVPKNGDLRALGIAFGSVKIEPLP